MTKTYLDLINIVLRDINEVPLSQATFTSPRGLQAFVKESINRSLMDIINYNDEWPWLTAPVLNPGQGSETHTFNTVVDVSEYAFPAGIDEIDYDNVIIIDNDDPDSQYVLEFVEYDEIQDIRNDFEDTVRPRFVYQTPSKDYIGLFPKPDDAYTVRYIAWLKPTFLVNATDTLPFDDRYYTVIVSRARYYAWLFRENTQQASIALNEYEDNLRMMYKNIVLPRTRRMRAI